MVGNVPHSVTIHIPEEISPAGSANSSRGSSESTSWFGRVIRHLSSLAGPASTTSQQRLTSPRIEQIQRATSLVPDLAYIIDAFVLECFGAEEWRRYYQVEVGPAPEFSESFYKFWNGPDPIDPHQPVYRTHLPPVLRPEFVTNLETGIQQPFNLKILNELVQNPVGGGCPSQHTLGDATTPAGPKEWLVMRQGIIKRNKKTRHLKAANGNFNRLKKFIETLNRRTQADYQSMPTPIDLATVVLTRHTATGERHLGDPAGEEWRFTYSYTTHQCIDAHGTAYNLVIGDFSRLVNDCNMPGNVRGGLGFSGVHLSYEWVDMGVALVRREPQVEPSEQKTD